MSALSYSPEDDFLFSVLKSLSRPEDAVGDDGLIQASLPAEFQWEEFHKRVVFHRIGPLIYEALCELWGEETPPDIIRRRDAHHMRRVKRNLSDQANMARISQAFQRESIPFLLMKGAAIAHRYYPSPIRRIAIDIDILTSKEDFPKGCSILRDLGYEQHVPNFDVPPHLTGVTEMFQADYTFRNQKTKGCVEIHTRFTKNPHFFPLTFEEAMTQAEDLMLGQQKFTVLRPEIQFLYGCIHGAKHNWFRLKWLCDIDFMIGVLSPSDWEAVWSYADRMNLSAIVDETLGLHAAIFGARRHDQAYNASSKAVSFYMDTILKMKVFEGMTLSDVGYIWSVLVNKFTRAPNWKARGYDAFLFFAHFSDVQLLRLPKIAWPIYFITGIIRRIFMVFARSAPSKIN